MRPPLIYRLPGRNETLTGTSVDVESAMGESIASFVAYFRDHAPTRIRATLQVAGIISQSGIERDTTDRVLEEAVTQILSGYHTMQDQRPTTQNLPGVPRHQLAEQSQSTPHGPSLSDYTESQGRPFSTNALRDHFKWTRSGPTHLLHFRRAMLRPFILGKDRFSQIGSHRLGATCHLEHSLIVWIFWTLVVPTSGVISLTGLMLFIPRWP